MKRWIILCIIIFAAFVRVYNLSTVPPAPSLDEVSLGYNAYSILKTGQDEYGARLPVLLRAYDDFRPALYVYLVVPFVWALGLTPIAVRLPSVLLSLGSVYLLYLLVLELCRKQPGQNAKALALIAAALLALSPWHVYLSRLGHEVNFGFFLTLAFLWTFVAFVANPKKGWRLVVAAVAFGLSFWSYQSQKLIMPLLGLVFTGLYWKVWQTHLKTVCVAGVFALLLAAPAIAATFTGGGLLRLQGSSAFTGDHAYYRESVVKYAKAIEQQHVLGQLYYSRKFTHMRVFGANYLSHFAPGWLFTGDARESHKIPFTGLMYGIKALFLAIGAWLVVKGRIQKSTAGIILAVLLISPLPAAITTQAPHAMRAYTMLIALTILVSLGVAYFYEWLKKKAHTYARAILTVFIIFALWAVGMAGWNYFMIFPKTQSDSFQYALHLAILYVVANEGAYEQIVFSNEGNAYQSYMFFLFHTRRDPQLYLQEGGTGSGGYAESHTIGTSVFRPFNSEEQLMPDTLYVVDSSQVPPSANVLATFTNLDGVSGITAFTL